MPRLSVLTFLILPFSVLPAYADTLYLKNGHHIEGVIRKESKNVIEFYVSGGTVQFFRNEIERIVNSTPTETAQIYQKWEKEKVSAEQARVKAEEERERSLAAWRQKQARLREELSLTKEISVIKEKGQIVVKALLNQRVEALLVLDTGASLVLLTKATAEKLGIDTQPQANPIELQMADGSKVKARQVVLESVKVEDVEVKDVPAAVLTEEVKEANFKDGLLGMSFLSHFDFSVDQGQDKLILKKAK